MRGGTCSTKPVVDTSGRTAISREKHNDVLEGTLGNTLGGMVGNLTFPHYNALAQTLSTVAENMVEDVMSKVLPEIDDNEIERMVCEAFKRACYITVWGSNPFIKDFTEETVEQDNPVEKIRHMIENGILEKIKATTGNSGKTIGQDDSVEKIRDMIENGILEKIKATTGNSEEIIGQDNSTKEDRYNLRKIYMKNLGNKGETDNVMMSYFSPHVFRYAISNMGLGGVVKTKLKGIEDELKKQIIDKIEEASAKFKDDIDKTKNLTFEWVDKEEFIQKKQVNAFAPPTSTSSVFKKIADAIKPEEKPPLTLTSWFSPKAYAEKLGKSMAKGAIYEGRISVSNGFNTLANYGSRNNQLFTSVPP